MEHIIEKKEIGKNVSIKVLYDDASLNPRNHHENLWTIFQVGFSGYDLGDVRKIANSFDEGKKFLNQHLKSEGLRSSECIIVPLYLFQHGNVKIERSRSCIYDSGFLGFAYVSKKAAREWYSTKLLSKHFLDLVDNLLSDEIYYYNMYLNSEVMRGIVYETNTGREITEYNEFYLEDANEVIDEVIGIALDDDFIIVDEETSTDEVKTYILNVE